MPRDLDHQLAEAEEHLRKLKQEKKRQLSEQREQRVCLIGELVVASLEKGTLPQNFSTWLESEVGGLPKKKQSLFDGAFARPQHKTEQPAVETPTEVNRAAE